MKDLATKNTNNKLIFKYFEIFKDILKSLFLSWIVHFLSFTFKSNCYIILATKSCLKVKTMHEYIIYNNTPSVVWEDSYPVGNGRMGATIMGHVDEEVLYLNEETVWSSQGKGIPNPNMAD